MRLLVLSDLHLELGATYEPPSGLQYDAVILAGDIHAPGTKVIEWARRTTIFGPDVPIIFVPGNHEFYGCVWPQELAAMREVAAGTNVVVLAGDETRLPCPLDPTGPGLRVLGVTLWTDFRVPVQAPDGRYQRSVKQALATANLRLNDFQTISLPYSDFAYQRPTARLRKRPLKAEDTLAAHWVDRDWLESKLAEPFDGKTVVVTHHAPAMLSVAPEYLDDWLTPSFVSELPPTFFDVPALWVHGHTHTAFDYQIASCRVVSNPRGYRQRNGGVENPSFAPGLIIEV